MSTQPAERTPAPRTAVSNSSSRTVGPIVRFLAELGGMCAVMCAGGSILSFASFEVANWLGYPNLVQQSPEFSVVIVTACLALPMAVYMAIRGHDRRQNLQMTGSAIAVGMVVMGLLWSGVISTSGLQTWHDLFGLVCGPACMVMIVEMVINSGTYSRRPRCRGPVA